MVLRTIKTITVTKGGQYEKSMVDNVVFYVSYLYDMHICE